jgi:hypothetical protein
MFTGLRRTKLESEATIGETLNMIIQSILGMIYMIHWYRCRLSNLLSNKNLLITYSNFTSENEIIIDIIK